MNNITDLQIKNKIRRVINDLLHEELYNFLLLSPGTSKVSYERFSSL